MKKIMFVLLFTVFALTAYAQTANDYREAANRGDADAQYNYGWCYYEGNGVPLNYEHAFMWFKKSAEQGNAAAQNKLGWCYLTGDGVTKDDKQAFEWWKKSAYQGLPNGQFALGQAYHLGLGTAIDLRQAVYWYEMAAKQKNADAQYRMAYCHYYGVGTAKNITKAEQYARNAYDHMEDLAELNRIWCKALLFRLSKNKKTSTKSQQHAPIQRITIPNKDVSFDMVLVKAGSFSMGAADLENNHPIYALEDELPIHKVTITKDFYIGETEVTQELYEAVMGENPSGFFDAMDYPKDRACPQNLFPVERVSYTDAITFCARISALTGKTFTLPTEAQWEYAARGGHKNLSQKKIYGISDKFEEVVLDEINYPVGVSLPNILGLYETMGNVGEWCQDWYGPYSSKSQVDPKGPLAGTERVMRSICFSNGVVFDCTIPMRMGLEPDSKGWAGGFRIVMIP